MGYRRLSPFSPLARQTIKEIYQDLGRAATIIETRGWIVARRTGCLKSRLIR